ncbi:ArsR/SmtB family transcription factor [Corynebacterium sp. A21]|uniref:ArsR/SmtB family transcription factor n=1 Tax=Corynebacterium sp. A21 TaxID=3457318 RepID=UPI003FD42E58
METTLNGPERSEIDLNKVFSALADPHRRAIIIELMGETSGTERTCASFDVPLSKSSRTFHFRVLRDAGLTWDTDYGNRKGVILREEDIEARFPGLLSVLANSIQ